MINKRLLMTGISIFGVAATGTASFFLGNKVKGAMPNKENWKKFIFPVGIGVGTVGAIIIAHRMGTKEIAALSATCAYLAKNRDALEKKIEEKFGKEALDTIKKEIRQENKFYNGPSIEDTGKGDLLCMDGYSGRFFWSSKEAVEEAQRQLNQHFQTDIYACVNDYFEFLGIEQTHFGYQFGWVNDENFFEPSGIDFENVLVKDCDILGEDFKQDILITELKTYPMECWMEV